MSTFIAIDFETANQNRSSVCAVGLAAGKDGRIELVRSFLVCPPVSQFVFSDIHGIRWADVRGAPSFSDLWPTMLAWINDVEFIAAHNASFDRSVLQECCATFRLRAPQVPFVCTVRLARWQWGIYPTRLPNVCRRLGIRLSHHDPASDAEACARIVLAAEAEGWQRRRSDHR